MFDISCISFRHSTLPSFLSSFILSSLLPSPLLSYLLSFTSSSLPSCFIPSPIHSFRFSSFLPSLCYHNYFFLYFLFSFEILHLLHLYMICFLSSGFIPSFLLLTFFLLEQQQFIYAYHMTLILVPPCPMNNALVYR